MPRLISRLLLTVALALPQLTFADGAPPRPLGHRSISRQHQFRGANLWPEQVFFVWPVLPVSKPCVVTATVIAEGGAVRDQGNGSCVRLSRSSPGDEPRERPDPQPRLMTLPKQAFEQVNFGELADDAVPMGAVVTKRPLTPPRWAMRPDPVLDEREDDELVFDGRSLDWRPLAISYLYRDGHHVKLPVGKGGQLPPPPLPGEEPAALNYQISLEASADLAGYRLFVATEDRVLLEAYVQDHWVEVEPGVALTVTTRARLPLLLAWPRQLGLLPAEALALARPGNGGDVLLLSHPDHNELKGALFGRLLFDLQPPGRLPGVQRLTEVIRLGLNAGESPQSANLLQDQRTSSVYRYGVGVEEHVDYPDDHRVGPEIEISIEPDLELDDPEDVLPLATEVTLGSPLVARIGASYGTPGYDAPKPDLLRLPPSGLLRVLAPRVGLALGLLVALWLGRFGWKRRKA